MGTLPYKITGAYIKMGTLPYKITGIYQRREPYRAEVDLQAVLFINTAFFDYLEVHMNRIRLYYIDIKLVRDYQKVDDNVLSVSPQTNNQNTNE